MPSRGQVRAELGAHHGYNIYRAALELLDASGCVELGTGDLDVSAGGLLDAFAWLGVRPIGYSPRARVRRRVNARVSRVENYVTLRVASRLASGVWTHLGTTATQESDKITIKQIVN